tara:strand:- start:747 stop:887 length:141 start_codon:yes stop_codon:yes gene_type:complete
MENNFFAYGLCKFATAIEGKYFYFNMPFAEIIGCMRAKTRCRNTEC